MLKEPLDIKFTCPLGKQQRLEFHFFKESTLKLNSIPIRTVDTVKEKYKDALIQYKSLVWIFHVLCLS